MSTSGRFTIPSESNFAEKTAELARLWGADAVRNSDGTQLDDEVVALGMKVYTAYFPTRAHNEWITLHMDETPQVYLLSKRALAESDTVDVSLMDGFFEEQLKPNFDADPHKYWEVVDRSTGAVVPTEQWTVDAEAGVVHVSGAELMHEYTVSFLACIIWDPVEMYNHLTNGWGDKEHEIPFDIYHPATRKFVFDTFEQ
ncbi:D-galactosyl-beta-1-3-N-acetyl-D-hexosamine phosphorylase, partial [Bifidobacterium bifidum]